MESDKQAAQTGQSEVENKAKAPNVTDQEEQKEEVKATEPAKSDSATASEKTKADDDNQMKREFEQFMTEMKKLKKEDNKFT